jgi:hypothetical protein
VVATNAAGSSAASGSASGSPRTTPGAPTAVTATPGNAQLAVSWTAPASNGGATITTYTATTSPGGLTCTATGSPAGTSCTISGLTNGTSYTVTVTATNAAGTGPSSTASAAAVPVGTPGTPAAPTLSAGDAQLSVSWTAPASNGATITAYTVTATPSDGSLATRTCSTSGSPAGTSCTVTALTNGGTYAVTVRATNSAGNGASSSSSTGIPYPATIMTSARLALWLDGADASTFFTDTAGTAPAVSGNAVARWNDKSGRGLNALQTSATLRPVLGSSTASNGRVVPVFDGTDDKLDLDITKLPTGSAASTQLAAAGLSRAPGAYSMLTWWGTSSPGAVRNLWLNGSTVCVDRYNQAPVLCDGTVGVNTAHVLGAAFTSSTLSVFTSGRTPVSSAISLSTGTTSGNLGGQGPWWGGPVDEQIIFADVLTTAERRTVEEYLARKWGALVTPAAPTGVGATAGAGQIAATWSAPSWNGGSSVTGYTATATPSGGGSALTCTTAGATNCTITGLTNGTTYTVTVTATNAVGTGPSSAGASATPTGAPGAPGAPVLTAADGQLGVSWAAPASNGGSAITGYTATTTPGSFTCTTSGTTSCTISGLTNGTSYSVAVTATNASGTGSASSSTTGIPYPASIMTSARLRLWLDGADASTRFQDTAGTTAATTAGQSVALWRDKSGQANDAVQSTSGNRPTLTTVNGRLVPGFNGTSSYMNLTVAKLPTGTTTSTVLLAGTLTGSTSSGYDLLTWGGSSGTSRDVYQNAGDICADTRSGGPMVCRNGSVATNRPFVVNAEYPSSQIAVAVDGSQRSTGAGAINTGTSYATLGAGDFLWPGQIPEVLVFTGSLTSAEGRVVEEYLARKWSTTVTPSAPTLGTATAANGSIAVTWTAPTWNGGSAVTGYTATATPSGGGAGTTCTTTGATSCTITGLTNGTAYTVTVTATNAVGTGPSSSSASATPVSSCTPGSTTVTADADAYVDSSVPSGNYNSTQLQVQSFSGNDQRTYVHFPLPSIPAGCSATGATLKLTVQFSNATGRTLQAYAAAGSWTETGLTASNQPGLTGAAATATSASSGVVQFAVSGAVTQGMYSSNNGLVVKDASEGSAAPNKTQVFASSEAGTVSNRPQLTVSYS